jgi:hypothetical protein
LLPPWNSAFITGIASGKRLIYPAGLGKSLSINEQDKMTALTAKSSINCSALWL